jgi:hypothetical protein
LDVTHYLLWVFTRVREDVDLGGMTQRVGNDATGNNLWQARDLILDRVDV